MSDQIMIDYKKRKTLKILGTGTGAGLALVSLPASTTLAGSAVMSSSANKQPPVKYLLNNRQIEMFIDVSAQPTITFKNVTSDVAIVRHVHPGIVHAGENTFDINSVLDKSAIGIGAGRSRTFAIKPTHATQNERYYSGLKQPGPQQLAHLSGANSSGQIINSNRSFFS